ncbi:hypothetical protein [Archaeoglobus veneficus]|uniref:Uncharacterized protein n=1 Tax=Archaeoglobus veneficus (strain DSM 11195 / SNP6) TaxID=693661 RepID=F2KSY7_ARCVS|nr:hypothetical protein [Archaeoglobus veneficus]AEA48131.1 hypothetical protein Arcve_2142 [Archaeoglobus veneficus SNP6]
MRAKVLQTLSTILSVQTCLANPIPPNKSHNLPPALGTVFALDYICNLVILAILLTLFQKDIRSLKFLAYVLVVTAGGLIIDYLAMLSQNFVVALVLAFLLLFSYNSVLARLVYGLSRGKSAVIGFSIGILANPALFVWITIMFL